MRRRRISQFSGSKQGTNRLTKVSSFTLLTKKTLTRVPRDNLHLDRWIHYRKLSCTCQSHHLTNSTSLSTYRSMLAKQTIKHWEWLRRIWNSLKRSRNTIKQWEISLGGWQLSWRTQQRGKGASTVQTLLTYTMRCRNSDKTLSRSTEWSAILISRRSWFRRRWDAIQSTPWVSEHPCLTPRVGDKAISTRSWPLKASLILKWKMRHSPL